MPVSDDESMRCRRRRGQPRTVEAGSGERAEEMSDAELMDSIDYTLFPNFHPWGAFNRIVYRFRPNGDDHRARSWSASSSPRSAARSPPTCRSTSSTEDETFIDAPELGMLGKVFNQDLFNMSPRAQGLETTRKPGVTLGNYQESKIRWLHDKLDQWVNS